MLVSNKWEACFATVHISVGHETFEISPRQIGIASCSQNNGHCISLPLGSSQQVKPAWIPSNGQHQIRQGGCHILPFRRLCPGYVRLKPIVRTGIELELIQSIDFMKDVSQQVQKHSCPFPQFLGTSNMLSRVSSRGTERRWARQDSREWVR